MIMATEESSQNTFSLKLDDSTRERIRKISMQRKRSVSTQEKKSERKSIIGAAADKWAVSDDDFPLLSSSLHSQGVTPRGKRPSARTKRRDDLSMSEHTGRAKKLGTHSDGPITKAGDKNGQLDDFIGRINEAKPLKRRGPKTVASMPVSGTKSEDNEEDDNRGRSKSPHRLKKKVQSSRSMKKRSSSPGPMKIKRSASMKKRSESPGTLKRRTSKLSKKSFDSEESEVYSRILGEDEEEEKLGKMLGKIDSSTKKKKSSSRSVSSAPGLARRESRRTRKAANVPASSRRARSSDQAESLIDDDDDRRKSSTKPKRSKSADPTLHMDEPGTPKRLSQRLSKGIQSFRKLAGFGNSENTSSTQLADSSSTEQEQAPKRNGRAERRESMSAKKKRSNSAGPLTMRQPASSRDKRKALMKGKKAGSLPVDEPEEEDPPPPRAPIRAQSMMLHREATRRNKANSLKDLVQYSEEEIHSTSYFASNHVLVNRERMKRGLRPLTRNIQMDELARLNAERMANSDGGSAIQATYVGNVLRGDSIRAIHRATMLNKDGRERANLLNPYFQEFGVGTSKAPDGMLYVCQLFSERLELTVTDTSET